MGWEGREWTEEVKAVKLHWLLHPRSEDWRVLTLRCLVAMQGSWASWLPPGPLAREMDLTEVGKELALLECLLRARHENRCSLGNACVGWTLLAPCTDEETCSWRESHLPRTPLLTSSLTPLVTLSPTTFVIPVGMGSEAFK